MTRVSTFGGLSAALVLASLVSGCASDPRARIVRAPPVCQDITVQIYFEPDSALVTKEARAVLRAAANRAKACRVERVTVLGLADAVGAPDANLDLSKRRAASVTQALAATKLPAAEFDTAAAGQAGAVTAAGDPRLLRRRADVTLKLAPPR